MKIKIMVVDDSALYRQLVRNVLRNFNEVEVVGQACTGKEALEQIPELQPDLLTLDVQMPDMNGLELLCEIKKRRLKVKAIMLSSLTTQGAKVTTDALMAGAFDFVQKPSGSDANANRLDLEGLLSEKIKAFQQSRNVTMPLRRVVGADVLANRIQQSEDNVDSANQSSRNGGSSLEKGAKRIDAVVIGTSTGGPIALREVIPRLPLNLNIPVFVVQHMPAKFTLSLAARLGEVSRLPVHEAANNMKVESNHVYLAAGGLHMGFEMHGGNPVIRTSEDPPEHNCRPAVDYTFRSACKIYAGNLLGVILTGMGRDGADGCRLIKQLGGSVLTQHPEGCTVYGMPKVVVEEQLADRVVPIEKMASWIVRMTERSRVAPRAGQ